MLPIISGTDHWGQSLANLLWIVKVGWFRGLVNAILCNWVIIKSWGNFFWICWVLSTILKTTYNHAITARRDQPQLSCSMRSAINADHYETFAHPFALCLWLSRTRLYYPIAALWNEGLFSSTAVAVLAFVPSFSTRRSLLSNSWCRQFILPLYLCWFVQKWAAEQNWRSFNTGELDFVIELVTQKFDDHDRRQVWISWSLKPFWMITRHSFTLNTFGNAIAWDPLCIVVGNNQSLLATELVIAPFNWGRLLHWSPRYPCGHLPSLQSPTYENNTSS